MDFAFTEEQELLAESLVEFMDREYPESLIKECDEQKVFPVEANKKFYEAGFGAIGVPEELGGVPADMVTMCLVTSIVYRYSWAGCTYSPLSIMNAADKASPEIRTEMLEGLMSGEKRHSFGNTEPGAGSDAAGIKTSYKKVDGGYVINGHKIYNTYASCSDYNIITAKDPEIDDPYKAVTLFAIPNPTPGMTIVDLPTIGQWLEPTCETFLEDCFIPDTYLYGKEHGGWVQLMKHFEAERLLCAAMYLGQAETAFADLCAYANSRIQFGQPIGKFQLIQEKVRRDKIILESMRNMVFRTAWEYDQGKSIRIDANISKLLCTEGNWQICDDGIQILGGLGYCTDHRMQRLWRDARVGRIGAGSSEILTKTIAKDVLREAGQYGGGTRALGI